MDKGNKQIPELAVHSPTCSWKSHSTSERRLKVGISLDLHAVCAMIIVLERGRNRAIATRKERKTCMGGERPDVRRKSKTCSHGLGVAVDLCTTCAVVLIDTR